MQKLNKDLVRVTGFASKDETRPHLGYCVHDGASKALVATDGHKAILDRSLYKEGMVAFKAEVYLKTGELIGPSHEGWKYPNVVSFYPNLDKYSQFITWAVPEWVSKLKDKKAVTVYMTLENEVSLTKPLKGDWIALDLKLLAPLAGESVKFSFKISRDDESRVIIDRLAPIYFLVTKDIDGVVMPMRA